MKLSSLSLSLLVLAGTAAFAQTPGVAGATNLTPITINRDTPRDKGASTKITGVDLYFGRFVKGTAFTAVLAPDATYDATTAGSAAFKGSQYTPGYELSATASQDVTIAAADTKVAIGASAAADDTMDVTAFTFDLSYTTGNGTKHATIANRFTTNASGKLGFNVGATLAVKSTQNAGSYTGNYSLTAIYN